MLRQQVTAFLGLRISTRLMLILDKARNEKDASQMKVLAKKQKYTDLDRTFCTTAHSFTQKANGIEMKGVSQVCGGMSE